MSFLQEYEHRGKTYKEEVGVKVDKECDEIIIEESIVSFILDEDNQYLIAREQCDSYFVVALPKPEVKMLIDGLQKMYDKMIDQKEPYESQKHNG